MRRLIAIFAALLIAAPAAPAAAQETDLLELRLKKGDKVTFETVKSRTQRGGATNIDVKVHWDATLEVIDADENAFVFAWTRQAMKMWKDKPMPAAASDLADLAANARIELIVTRDGQIAGIRNYDQVKKMIDESLVETRRIMLKAGADEAKIDQALAMTRQMFANRDTATSVMTQDIAGFFLAYGFEVEPRGTLRSESALGNPLGGEPIPATFALKVNDYKPEDAAIKALWIEKVNAEAAKELLKQIVRQLAPDKADEFEKSADADSVFNIVNSGGFNYDRKRGLVTHALGKREAKVANATRVDTWEWVVKQPGE